jgi:hypothetical protein
MFVMPANPEMMASLAELRLWLDGFLCDREINTDNAEVWPYAITGDHVDALELAINVLNEIGMNAKNERRSYMINDKQKPIETTEADLAEMKVAPMEFFSEHWVDPNQNPAGGVSTGMGFNISWQNGPLGRGKERRIPNGTFVEKIIYAAIDRIQFYQRSKFKCEDNEDAIMHLQDALLALETRTAGRDARKVEGTHEP